MSYTVEAAFQVSNKNLARIGLDNALERASFLEGQISFTGQADDALGYPVTNALTRNTYETWQSDNWSPRIAAEWDDPTTVNYVAVARHNLADISGTMSLWVIPTGTETTTFSEGFSDDSDLANWYRGLNSVDGAYTITGGVLRYTKGAGDSDLPRIVRALTVEADVTYRLRNPTLGGTASFKRFYVTTNSDGSDVGAISALISNTALDVTFTVPAATTTVYLVLRENGVGTDTGFTAEIADIDITKGITKVLDFTAENNDPFLIPFLPTAIDRAEIRFDATNYFIGAVVYLGNSVVMERPLRASMDALWLSRNTAVVNQESATGQLLGSIVTRQGVSVAPSWSNLSKSFYNSSLRGLARDMPANPFFLAWQPDEHPDEVIYGSVTGDPSGSHIARSDRYNFDFSMTGI